MRVIFCNKWSHYAKSIVYIIYFLYHMNIENLSVYAEKEKHHADSHWSKCH